MKKLLKFLLLLLLLILIICLVKTFTQKSLQENIQTLAPISVADSALSHFQKGIQFPTISYDSLPPDSAAFNGFYTFLTQAYPLTCKTCRIQKVAKYTLIFQWKASRPIDDSVVVMMAHQDVVPVEEASLKEWKAPPFSGNIIGDTIYGRGANDDKLALFSILEATEKLLAEGYTPARDVYFVFGHDEEKGGSGAEAAVSWFKKENIHPKWVFDEGGEITQTVPGIKKSIAIIGTSEKGYMNVSLKVKQVGGHSSMPAKETAIDILSNAIGKIRNQPFKASFNPSMDAFLDYLGPEMSFTNRFFVSNRWLFDKVLLKIYAKSPASNALIRTTVVPTIIQAGNKANVIPNIATATLNLRLAPGMSVQNTLDHLQQSIQDTRVELQVLGHAYPASQVTDVHSEGFQLLAHSIHENYSNILVAPYLMIGATDGRKFEEICKTVIRFSPATDLKGMHGINERIGVQEYKKSIGLYYRVLKGIK